MDTAKKIAWSCPTSCRCTAYGRWSGIFRCICFVYPYAPRTFADVVPGINYFSCPVAWLNFALFLARCMYPHRFLDTLQGLNELSRTLFAQLSCLPPMQIQLDGLSCVKFVPVNQTVYSQSSNDIFHFSIFEAEWYCDSELGRLCCLVSRIVPFF